ncbi:putative leucine-rich repeat protein [Trypanosoma conorhini]|uniref:Putative leucine-rich repeat protein n=1 Tax=Trypanosoma conorhini TaxID=83891 RepID=A0A422Q1U8_9TRYP|nr:putative leucine-rich repeat protein [Trypanosoma conorhini]RNF23946.1 putative leucine-rich repeat protein [Trypanosoma conorhini]
MSARSGRPLPDGASQKLEAPAATATATAEVGLLPLVHSDNERWRSNSACSCSCCRNNISGNAHAELSCSHSQKTPSALPKMAPTPANVPSVPLTPLSGRLRVSREISSGDRPVEFRLLAANTPPVSVIPLPPPQQPRLPGATPMPSGVSVQRYRAKLEECAELHRRLQDAATELTVTRDQLFSVKLEANSFVNEIQRLKDVLFVATSELQSTQQRVDELQRENKRMAAELRARQALATDTARRVEVSSVLRSALGAVAEASTYGSEVQSCRLTHSAAEFCLDGDAPSSLRQAAGVDASKTAAALVSYAVECFRAEVMPHMELLHSLYDGGRLMAVDPPISHAQLSALRRVLVKATGLASPGEKEGPSPPQLRQCGSFASSAALAWMQQVELLSFRCENWHASLSTLLYLIRSLESVRDLELFSLSDAAVARQLTGALLMAPHVEMLSLPELSLDDEGLAVLFAFLVRREQLATRPPLIKASPASASSPTEQRQRGAGEGSAAGDSAEYAAGSGAGQPPRCDAPLEPPLALPCLDLSRCTIEHPTALFRTFRGTSVEVLVLTGCAALRDVHVRGVLAACPQLHTLDLSGSEGLTTACVTYISQHERLRVLRLENCPAVKQIELANVEVLFSSLAYVTRLWAPELRRLPTPLTHSHVLFDFYAPKLAEVTLKGVVVDCGTLAAFVSGSDGDGATERTATSADVTLSCSIPSVEKLLQQQQQQQEEQQPREAGEEQEEAEVPVPGEVAQLLSVGFIGCTIAAPAELNAFLRQQAQLLRLSLHGCQGVVDANLAGLPATIMELDVGGVAQLTGSSIAAIVTRLPQLIKLSLKNAGAAIENADLHRLRGLGNLEVLNLLGLPQLLPEVVAAVAGALPRLRVLYHETAVLEHTRPTVVVQVLRSDEEDTTRQDIHHCSKELLHLRNETALALWMEAQLPKPAQLLPQSYVPTHGVSVGAPQPPLTKNTTFYELTKQTLSSQGTFAPDSEEDDEPVLAGDEEKLLQQEQPDVLQILGDEEEAPPHLPSTERCDDDEENEDEKSRASLYDTRRRTESAMDERSRLAIEKTPLGPWGEADIVAEHRRHSGN